MGRLVFTLVTAASLTRYVGNALKAITAHWIRRIDGKAGCQLLLYMDRVVQEELEDGTAEFEKSEIRKDWTVCSQR